MQKFREDEPIVKARVPHIANSLDGLDGKISCLKARLETYLTATQAVRTIPQDALRANDNSKESAHEHSYIETRISSMGEDIEIMTEYVEEALRDLRL